MRYLPEVDVKGDVEKAIKITLEDEQRTDCLCHGEFGNLEICAIAAQQLENTDWEIRTKGKLARIWRGATERQNWRSGLPSRTLGICGMFMGTAGVGYGLLRAARPDVVPSVLFLEDPKKTSIRT